MEKIGIICEYNPFHNGHKYHINQIKEMYPDSIIILIMSGYFTERGDVSLISKYNKTRIALNYGVDIVLELPTLYGVNSADYFAESSIRALNYAKVDKIIFGSECNDIDLLKNAAKIQINNKDFDAQVKKELENGSNYPTALSKSCNYNFSPNDILGISYIKTIIKNDYKIEPVTIKRTNDFNDTVSNETIVSAENIRLKLKNEENIEKYIPEYDITYINKINEDKMFELLKYKIITDNSLQDYLGVDEGLENKIKKEIYHSTTFDELIENIKSKRYTYVRLKRMLTHILIGIKKSDMLTNNNCYRILGFTTRGKKYLKELKSAHLVYKYNHRIRDIEINSKEVYYMLTNDLSCKEELLNKPIEKTE